MHAGPASANMEPMAGLPRFRRSRRAMLAILIAAFLLGVQGGLMVLPMDGEGAGESGVEGDAGAESRGAPATAPDVEVESVDPAPDPALRPEVAPREPSSSPEVGVPVAAVPVSDPAPAPTSVADPEPGDGPPEDPADPAPDPAELRRRADADRLWGCIRTMAAEDLVLAFDAAEAAGRLDLRPDGRSRLGAAWTELCGRVQAKVDGALRAAAAGDVATATEALVSLFGIGGRGAALARGVVRDAAAAAGIVWGVGRRGQGEVSIGRPDPLPRGLPVAFVTPGGVRFEGTVRAERAGVVSVEVAGPGGRRFPSAPRPCVQPLDASPALALDQCAAALAAGERAWAVAWWARARALGADPARLELLAAFLGD